MASLPPENGDGPYICAACNTQLRSEGLRFPKDPELRQKWVDVIMAETPDYPGKKAYLNKTGLQLCPEHFDPNMLFRRKEGKIMTYALQKGGFPTSFDVPQVQNGPKSDDEDIEICYEQLPSSVVKTQLSDTDPEPEVMDIEDNIPNSAPKVEAVPVDDISTNHEPIPNAVIGELSNNMASQTDVIPSLQEFIARLKEKDDEFYDPWKILYPQSSVLFVMFDSDCKYLVQSFTVDENLKVSVFYHGQPFTNDGLKLLLGVDSLLHSWIQFKTLIYFLDKVTLDNQHHALKLKHACKLIQECIDSGSEAGFSEKQINRLKFSLNQVQISDGKDVKYTTENLGWAMNAYIVNRQGYTKIYESDFLTLPHPASLEIYRRQLTLLEQQRKQQQLIRSKVVPRYPLVPSTQNGVNSINAQVNNISVLKSKDNVQQSSLNKNSANHYSPVVSVAQNKLPGHNYVTVDDDDCEIQLLQG